MTLGSKVSAALFISTICLGSAFAADMPAKVKPVVTVPENPFFLVNDNRLSYSYIFNGTAPGVTGKTAKQVYNFTHFDVWAYGTNFFSISVNKSDHNDPAVGGTAGSTEFYGILRSTFGFNQIFDTKAFSVGPLRNVSFVIGGDANTHNNAVHPAKRLGLAGLQFQFGLPYKGFLNISPMVAKELNHNAFLSCATLGAPPCLVDGNTRYKTSWALEINYYMDLGFLPDYLPISISGRAGFYGPKGNQNSPLNTGVATVTEINTEPVRLTLDASKMIWGPKYSHFTDVWVAYRYWQNKFGIDHARSPTCTGLRAGSCTEESLHAGITVKF
ncbi:hypothetical protein OCA5_c11980 [Afipia carboxidovorans OM5]|uniref:Porin n=1 Tax=Afipia carboxidovorans (strain ATCC 49405 / DSM 1227 / KCTC 32145 / OM5) TaxID=504832 RepID=F8BUW7_AFIC5|nr:hypothetical protein [Afipia carboxidovorans]AEI02340.1 hypothetical protein OCA4_c11980 [Afipia carboxidovorans OM4]AEI05916.1 hypothetical protein OCA5_c11980 [Afipia carboxidovorans OM5]BEV46701.1 hypothetical protein CRBSH125_28840 [Afipia carboxidovorans]